LLAEFVFEIALFVEDSWIDTIVACRVNKQRHYENIKDEGNVFYDNWNKYLLLNNNEFAHKIIAHLADRLLFLLSTSIASIICNILLVLIFKYSILPFLGLFIVVIAYVIFSFTRAISIAAGLDFLRHFILENQRNPVEQEEDALV